MGCKSESFRWVSRLGTLDSVSKFGHFELTGPPESLADAVASRVTGSEAVITPTLNPLVALYSAPPSSARTEFVQFRVAGDSPSWRNTNTLPVVPGKSTNFFVAGRLPHTPQHKLYLARGRDRD